MENTPPTANSNHNMWFQCFIFREQETAKSQREESNYNTDTGDDTCFPSTCDFGMTSVYIKPDPLTS